MIPAFIAIGLTAYLILCALRQRSYTQKLAQLEHRIHVNGIRGKSSVTRLIAATLRQAGIQTAAKTTGTAARIVVDHDTDIAIKRKEADIGEQQRIIRKYLSDTPLIYTGKPYQAIVFECMAINPLYQKYLEEKIMQSTIGVITNVREDHMDVMGHTLPDIARSLCATIPQNGHLVTAEQNPELLAIIREECSKRNSKLHVAKIQNVSDRTINRFHHFEYKENVAIALEVAKILHIPRNVAIEGMLQTKPDEGAFVMQPNASPYKKTSLYWANLFAINDRESFITTVNSLQNKMTNRTKKAVILNNRHDRPDRVQQFTDICLRDIRADYIITFGDYEQDVLDRIAKFQGKKPRVIAMGNSSKYKDASGHALYETIARSIHSHSCIVYGAVNVHTPQASGLLGAIGEQLT